MIMNKFQINTIKQAMDGPESLTDSDNEFIDSIASKEELYELSDRQNSWLNDIRHKLDFG